MNLIYHTIFINGDPFNCSKLMSLKSLLIYLDFEINTIVVEYNNEIIPHHKFDNILFNNKDKLEIITIVGGG